MVKTNRLIFAPTVVTAVVLKSNSALESGGNVFAPLPRVD
jgi:hypothetical protein